MVGAARFELATYWSQTSRATKLRYTPLKALNTLLIYAEDRAIQTAKSKIVRFDANYLGLTTD